jgi:uncharacterized phage protein gp47/JayE
VPTKEEIHDAMLEEISSDYEKIPGSFVYDTTGAPAVALQKVYEEIEIVESKQSIDNLSGEELEQRIYERTGIKKHHATSASTIVIITGQPGVTINSGDKVASETNVYSFVESKVIGESGQTTILIKSDEPGTIGNTPANTIVNFPITLEGLTSVTNPNPVTNGFNAETDDALRKRYYDKLQAPATSGNKAHYKIWATEVTGVGDAKIFPTWNGGGTVKVVVINSNKRAADDELIAGVYGHIEENRPIGATVTVESAIEKAISIAATLVLANGYSVSQVQQTFEQSLIDHFASIAFNETYVSHAKIGNILLETPGVGDYSNLLVNNNSSNVLLDEVEIPFLNSITLGV